MQGRLIIDFERDEKKEKCSYNYKQEGKYKLKKEELILLLENIIRDIMD